MEQHVANVLIGHHQAKNFCVIFLLCVIQNILMMTFK